MSDTHDLLLKDLLSNREFSIGFLQNYMPSEIVKQVDWSTIVLNKASVDHIRQQNKKNIKQKEQSDLCFNFKLNNGNNGAVFCHVELQSTNDETLILRTKHYQTSYLLDYIKRNKKVKRLPLVVSIIYYANKKPFTHSLNINDYFEDKELADKYAFDINLVDLTKATDQELENHGVIAGLEIIVKHIAERNIDHNLSIATKHIVDYESNVRQTLIRYMSQYSDLDTDMFYDRLIQSKPKLKGDIMTVAEQWEQVGVEKGEYKAKQETAMNMLEQGITSDIIVKCTGLDVADLNKLKAKLDTKH